MPPLLPWLCAPSLREGFARGDIACMPKLGEMRRRAVVTVLGALYFLVSLPLAETGGNILGGVCDEPSDLDNGICHAIYPEGADAWQVIPVVAVALLVVVAIYRSSLRVVHMAMALGLLLTLVLPVLFVELFLS